MSMSSMHRSACSIIFCLVIFITAISAHDYYADGWQSASGFLLASIDPSKDPCRDFYGYACGRWANRTSREESDELRDAQTKLRDLLLKPLDKVELDSTKEYPKYQKWLRVFYDQCMDLSIMNETQLLLAEYRALQTSFAELKNLTERTGRTGSKQFAAWLMAGYLEQSFLGHLLAEANIDWIVSNCTKKSILKLSPPLTPYLKLPLEALIQNLKMLHAILGLEINNVTATREAERVKAFESDLDNLVGEDYDQNGGNENGKLLKLSNLLEEYPDIDWNAYFTGLFPDDWVEKWRGSNPQVLIIGDHYFKSIASMINRHPFQVLQNYSYWKLITQIKEFYVSKTSDGVSIGKFTKAKKEFCYGILKEFAPAAVARMYFDAMKADPIEWRSDVELLAQNILSAFRIFVSGQDWLDAHDKMVIVDRINGIRIDTGIPAWLANETEVNARTPRFDPTLSTLENVVNAHRLAFMSKFRPLITSHATFVEKPPVFQVGAQYMLGKIEVNLGQLLPPLFHHHYPLSVKYGMLGWLLGHELLHGFDQASLLEGQIRGQSWLRGDVEKMFHQRKRCMVKQYSAYCYKKSGGQCLSGVRMVNENIGDIEGLKIAYMAYKFVTQTIGAEPPVPELVKLTNDQTFFISAAQLHCGKEQDFFLKYEEHPPNKVRVEQSMRNFPVFAQAFRCRKGSKFSPIRTCSLWGRFVSPNQCDSRESSGWE